MYIYDAVCENIELYTNKIALICDDEYFTYNDLKHAVINFANQLNANNVLPYSKIGIIVQNKVEFIISLLAVNSIGAVAIPIYNKTGINKILNIVDKYKLNYIITDLKLDSYYELISLNTLDLYKIFIEIDKDSLNEVEIILFSSGTTCLPKAIMLTARNIYTNLIGISDYLRLFDNDIILIVKNLQYVSTIVGELLVGLYNKCTVVVSHRIPTPAMILNQIKKYKISIFFAVPFLLEEIVRYNENRFCQFYKLRIINFYGSKISKETVKKLIKIFANVNIIYSYGLTEASPRVTYITKDELKIRPGSVGRTLKNINVLINEADQNGCGEIVVVGENIMKGYYMNPSLTNKVIRDGKLFTGDIGYLDDCNYLYIKGRKDNMFIIAGKNIYPEEIEEIIKNFRGIKDVLVEGEINSRNQVDIIAYITVENVNNFNMSSLFKYLKLYLEDYKVPKQVVIVDNFERTISGKLLRNRN